MHHDNGHASLADILQNQVKLTPMMQQYVQVKKEHGETIVFFRMGDFYELFFEDAVKASQILGITLTHRGKLGDFKIPMAGIPHHAAGTYVDKLTKTGHKVAICEQVEDPKEAKGVVKRAVTQVVSPGMPYDLEKMEQTEQRYICSLNLIKGECSIVLIDFTTGNFISQKVSDETELLEKITLYTPKEIVTYFGQFTGNEAFESVINHYDILVTQLPEDMFDPKNSGQYIQKLIPNYKNDSVIKSNSSMLPAIGAIAYYICSTQKIENFFHIRPFQIVGDKKCMSVGPATLIGLEILPKSRDFYKDSVLGFMDKTKTSLGLRGLRNFFLSPLKTASEINKRLDIIDFFTHEPSKLEVTRELLANCKDIERILVKTSTGKITAQDMHALSQSINVYSEIIKEVKGLPKELTSEIGKKEAAELISIASEITNTLNDEIGASLDKGNLILQGVHKQRDKYFKLTNGLEAEIQNIEDKIKKKTKIQTLRVKRNNVHGYFVEVSKGQVQNVPDKYERIQTLTNAERYKVKELSELENEIVIAQDKLYKIELQIFSKLTERVKENYLVIQALANCITKIDIFQSLSWVSLENDFSRPLFKSEKTFKAKQMWHPLIKKNIKEKFVCHDIDLNNKNYFALITGPNMAGKTTVMREVAITQFLAQIGCYVPTKSSELGIVDALFSRLGANDDIIHGQSTFMVEMSETASILRHATSKSLIIFDEVGRGTSTYDGLSIAWALVEHLASQKKSICLFSTHYHELIDLVDQLDGAKNFTVETVNINGDVKFLYHLIEKGASQSFGIYVAKLAGIPKDVLKRSSEILDKLELNHEKKPTETVARTMTLGNLEIDDRQLCFFDFEPNEPPKAQIPQYLIELEKNLKSFDALEITPLEAIQKLHQIQSELRQ